MTVREFYLYTSLRAQSTRPSALTPKCAMYMTGLLLFKGEMFKPSSESSNKVVPIDLNGRYYIYKINLGRYGKVQGSMWKAVFSDSEALSNATKPASSGSGLHTASCWIKPTSTPMKWYKPEITATNTHRARW